MSAFIVETAARVGHESAEDRDIPSVERGGTGYVVASVAHTACMLQLEPYRSIQCRIGIPECGRSEEGALRIGFFD